MKIIKKPKIEPQTCKLCGAVVEVKYRHLKRDDCSFTRDIWRCPICNKKNLVKWEKE